MFAFGYINNNLLNHLLHSNKYYIKSLKFFGAIIIAVTKSIVVDCHRLSKNSKNTIVQVANEKDCYAILSKILTQKL